MGNLHKAMGSGAAVLDRPFSRLATTKKHQYQRKNIDLCGYHRPDYFAIFVYMCLFSKVCNRSLLLLLLLFLLLLLLLLLLLYCSKKYNLLPAAKPGVHQQSNLYNCIPQVSCPWFHWKYTSNWMLRFCKEMLHFYKNFIHSKDCFLLEETSTGQKHNSYVDLVVKTT